MRQGLTRRTLAVTCVSAGLLLGFAAPASAATFKGLSTQGEKVQLETDDTDAVAKASFFWVMDCTGGAVITDGTLINSLADSNPRRFKTGGAYSADYEKGFSADIKSRFYGERVSEGRFRGTMKLRAKLYKKGELIAKCKTGLLRYTADLKGPATTPTPRGVSGYTP